MRKSLLKLFLFLWVFLLGTANAWADGTCGDGLTWALSGEGSNKTLTISHSGSGTGAMTGDAANSYGWNNERGNISTIIVGNGVTSITPRAFQSCIKLTSVTLPNTLGSIQYNAFNSCNILTAIEIPASVTDIGSGAFAYCNMLQTITIGTGSSSFVTDTNGGWSILYKKDNSGNKSTLVCYPRGCTEQTYTIPSTVTAIQKWAFAGQNGGLKNLLIPEGVTSIGQSAFEGSGIEKIVFLSSTPCTLNSSSLNDSKIYVPNSKVDTYKAATSWSSYASKIEGFRYQLSNSVATLTLTPDIWPLSTENPQDVKGLSSLVINANAAVPFYNTATSPTKIGDFIINASGTTPVPSANYTMSPENTSSDAVGQKTATATLTGDYTGTVTTTYHVKTAATVTAPTAKELTYSGSAQTLVTEGTVNGGTIKYSLTTDGEYSTTIPQATNAGDYTVYYQVTPDADHGYINTASQKVNVTINKKTPEASEFTYTAPTSLTLDNTAKAATVVVNEGISGMGTIEIRYFRGNTDLGTTAPSAAGTYTVKINVAAGDNYTESTNLTSTDWTFTIAVAQNTTTNVTYGSVTEALAAAETDKTVKLLADVTESVTFNQSGKTVTLDLNDKMLKATTGSRVIYLQAGTLTIVDNAVNKTPRYWTENTNHYWENPVTTQPGGWQGDTETGKLYTTGGCITGGNLTSGNGAGISIDPGATLNFNQGNVVGNYIQGTNDNDVIRGGGISNLSGALTIGAGASVLGNAVFGTCRQGLGGGVRAGGGKTTNSSNAGTIAYNYAPTYGGGVQIHGATPFTNSGTIKNNSAYIGAGINTSGDLTLNNGSVIQDNTLVTGSPIDGVDSAIGGGVNVHSSGSVTVSGNVNITNNKKPDGTTIDNLYLFSGRKITISGAITNSSIGVSMADNSGTFTTGYITETHGADPKAYFSGDNNTYQVLPCLDKDGQAQISAYEGDDENIHWKIEANTPSEGNYKLTISRKGDIATDVAMPNYMYNESPKASNGYTKTIPWLPFYKVITDVVIGPNVTTVGAGCCAQGNNPFSNLTNITLNEGITKIFSTAFRDCSNLTSIDLPSSLTTIEKYAFERTGLTSIVIPENVTSIGQGAFCTNNTTTGHLNTFVLLRTDGTVNLGVNAFNNQTNVNIYVPNSKVSSYQGATNWSTYSGKIKGWTYRLSSDNATLTLNSTSEQYTGSAITPAAQSLVITANAVVPLYNTETTPAQLLSLTRSFTVDTQVYQSNYSLTYSNNTNAALSTAENAPIATATTVANKDYTFDASNPVTAKFTITKRPVVITASDQTVDYNTGDNSGITSSTEKAALTGQVEGHELSAITLTATAATSSQTQKTIVPSGATIMSSTTDVTANYEITYTPGTLTEQIAVPVASGWTTWYNHYDVDIALKQEGTAVTTLTPYIVTNVDTHVTATEKGYIQKETPYLLNYSGTAASSLKLDVIYNQQAITGMDNRFMGATTAITDASDHNYYVLQGSQFMLSRAATDAIPQYKCYIDMDPPSLARQRVLGIVIGGSDDGTTAIEGPVLQYEDDGSIWYDLQGRQLDGKPTKKGLYINNGRKVVIK